MLSPQDSWTLLSSRLSPLGATTVARAEAMGRVLAHDLAATVDLPPADVSAMDGYVLASDVQPGAELPVVAVAAAGQPLDLTLQPGQAAKIMTGAVVPAGGDRVVPVEQTDGGVDRVLIAQPTAAGAHIRRGGEVVRRGQPLLPAGTLLTPGAISLIASHGYTQVAIHRPPRVAVLTTGDEVVPPEIEPGPGQLRDSNTSFLTAAGRLLGLGFERLGIAPDDIDELRQRVAEGLERDVLLLCGGVSMGDFDFVEDVLAELGCELLFDRVAIQPGKPLVAGQQRGTGRWVFGLPGNPASVMVTFWLFVVPALRRLQGIDDATWRGALAAELEGPLPGAKGRDRFLQARVRFDGGRILATPMLPQGSHDVVAYAVGNALVRVPAHAEPAAAGDPCEILPLANWPAA